MVYFQFTANSSPNEQLKGLLGFPRPTKNASGNVSESFAYEFSTFTPLVEHSNYCYYYFHSYGEC